jgi:hypothetical protein
VIKTFTKIPDEIFPKEHLTSKFIKGRSWENAKELLGFVRFPIFAPIFFGQRAIEAFVYDTDFDNKVVLFSTKHLHRAKLI